MDHFLIPHKRQQVNDDDQEPCTSSSTENPELEENVDGDSAQKNTRRPPGPNDISLLPDSGPTCPDLKKYPSHMQGGQTRSFNKRGHQQYSWLEYSVVKDAAYCFACRHFTTSHLGRAEQSFTHNGFKNWKKSTMSLRAHDTSACHKFAMQAWGQFKLQKVTGATIYQAIDAGHAKTVVDNRQYIKAVINVLLYTACQNVAQRGHREKDESDNRGNFWELLNVLAKYDHTFEKKKS
ncbi:zinc finger MYM-type protein 1-like [Oratosquilla oratoria]|uniref:zinc finger MYM-type protein 1-like n=1 Tax=Oratosquilla oratoria TaxID=337810 RepID=UPI003F75F1CC